MQIIISNELKNKLPEFNICAYTFTLESINDATNLSKDITKLFEDLKVEYSSMYQLEDVVNIQRIKKVRDGYKKLGKDPSHTRPACEALLRRIIKNGNIYRLGDVIDIGNYLSLKLLKSICVVDLDKIVGDVFIRIGTKDDKYFGINRGEINVDRLPLYTDDISPFGNPTSDTLRTAITNETKNVLLMLINFDKETVKQDTIVLENILKQNIKINNFTKVNCKENDIYDER